MENQEPKTYRVQVAEFNAAGKIVFRMKSMTFEAFLEAARDFATDYQTNRIAQKSKIPSTKLRNKNDKKITDNPGAFFKLIDKEVSNENIVGGGMRGISFKEVSFTGCTFSFMNIIDTKFVNCQLATCVFVGCRLKVDFVACKELFELLIYQSSKPTQLTFTQSRMQEVVLLENNERIDLHINNSIIESLTLHFNDIRNFSISLDQLSQIKNIDIDVYTLSNIKKIEDGRTALNGFILFDKSNGRSVHCPVYFYKSIESGVLMDSDTIVDNLKYTRHIFGVHLIVSFVYLLCLMQVFTPDILKGVTGLPVIGEIINLSVETCLFLSPLSVFVLITVSAFLSNISRSLPYI